MERFIQLISEKINYIEVNGEIHQEMSCLCTVTSLEVIPNNIVFCLHRASVIFLSCFHSYCHLTWHFCRASDKRKLERIQERGLRAVFRDGTSKYEKLLNKAKLTTLYERRLQDIACLMYKVKHGMCPQSIRNLFSLSSTDYSFRGADFHIAGFHSVTYGEHSLRDLGPKLWNTLSSNLRNFALTKG